MGESVEDEMASREISKWDEFYVQSFFTRMNVVHRKNSFRRFLLSI